MAQQELQLAHNRQKPRLALMKSFLDHEPTCMCLLQNDPVEPQEYLPPAGYVDWTLSGLPYDPHAAKNISGYTWNREDYAAFQQLLQGGLHNETAQFVNIQTNMHPSKSCLGCPGVRHLHSHELLTLLFAKYCDRRFSF